MYLGIFFCFDADVQLRTAAPVYLVDAGQRGALGGAAEADRILLLAGLLQRGAQRAAGCVGRQRCRLELHLRVLGRWQQSGG